MALSNAPSQLQQARTQVMDAALNGSRLAILAAGFSSLSRDPQSFILAAISLVGVLSPRLVARTYQISLIRRIRKLRTNS